MEQGHVQRPSSRNLGQGVWIENEDQRKTGVGHSSGIRLQILRLLRALDSQPRLFEFSPVGNGELADMTRFCCRKI